MNYVLNSCLCQLDNAYCIVSRKNNTVFMWPARFWLVTIGYLIKPGESIITIGIGLRLYHNLQPYVWGIQIIACEKLVS